jgi:hypothetical protein
MKYILLLIFIFIVVLSFSQVSIGNKLISTSIKNYDNIADTITFGDSCFYKYSKTDFLFPNELDFYNYRSNNYYFREENLCYLYDTCEHINYTGNSRNIINKESFAYHYNFFGLPDTLYRLNSIPYLPYYNDYSKSYLEYDTRNNIISAKVFNNYLGGYYPSMKDSIYKDSATNNYTYFNMYFDSITENIAYLNFHVLKNNTLPYSKLYIDKNIEFDSISHAPRINLYDSTLFFYDANNLLDSSFKFRLDITGTYMQAIEKRLVFKDTINNISYDTMFQTGFSAMDYYNLYERKYIHSTGIDSIIEIHYIPTFPPTSFENIGDTTIYIIDYINSRYTINSYNHNIYPSGLWNSSIIDTIGNNEIIYYNHFYLGNHFDSTYIKFNQYNQLLTKHEFDAYYTSLPYYYNFMITDYYYDSTTLSILNNIDLKHLDIYPNPCKENFNILSDNYEISNSEYILIDNFGNIIQKGILKSQFETINIHHLSSGIYYVIINNKEKAIGKIIKI